MFTQSEKKEFGRNKAISEVKKLHSEFTFYWTLGDSHKKLGLKIWEMDSGSFYVTQSHHIHAPGQAGPYHSSRSMQSTADQALMTGIDNITAYGEGAIAEGHEFSDSWFIPNKDY